MYELSADEQEVVKAIQSVAGACAQPTAEKVRAACVRLSAPIEIVLAELQRRGFVRSGWALTALGVDAFGEIT